MIDRIPTRLRPKVLGVIADEFGVQIRFELARAAEDLTKLGEKPPAGSTMPRPHRSYAPDQRRTALFQRTIRTLRARGIVAPRDLRGFIEKEFRGRAR